MGVTVNGKSIQQIKNELRKNLPEESFGKDYSGHPCLSIVACRKQLDDVLGINYNIEVATPQFLTVNTTTWITVKLSLSIIDDEGKVIIKREALGGSSIVISSRTGEAISVQNDLENATHDALKRCCKSFGIGTAQLAKKKEGNAKNANPNNDTDTLKLHKVIIKGAWEKVGKNGYAVKAIESGKEIKLLVWQDGQDEISKTVSFERFMAIYLPGKELSFYGTSKDFRGEAQVVLSRPLKKEE